MEKFLIENQPFTQLSDHFGLSMMLAYRCGKDEKDSFNSSQAKFSNNFEVGSNMGDGENGDTFIVNISKEEIYTKNTNYLNIFLFFSDLNY